MLQLSLLVKRAVLLCKSCVSRQLGGRCLRLISSSACTYLHAPGLAEKNSVAQFLGIDNCYDTFSIAPVDGRKGQHQ